MNAASVARLHQLPSTKVSDQIEKDLFHALSNPVPQNWVTLIPDIVPAKFPPPARVMPRSIASSSSYQTSSASADHRSLQHSPRRSTDDDEDDDEESSASSATGGMEKFPDHIDSHLTYGSRGSSPARTNGYALPGAPNGGDRWQPRKESIQGRAARWAPPGQPATRYGHDRQKSLGDAIHNIRTRGGSVSQNAHEIADALRAPVSLKLIVSCCKIPW